MEKSQSPFFEWPKISFETIENIDIDDKIIKFSCQSFFALLHLPETTFRIFYTFLTSSPKEINSVNSHETNDVL